MPWRHNGVVGMTESGTLYASEDADRADVDRAREAADSSEESLKQYEARVQGLREQMA